MSTPDPSVARLLLQAAHEDAKALEALTELPEIADAIVGFHAQQAVEKSLKAVLPAGHVAFRRTHDLAELIDLLADSGLPTPPHADTLDMLNPYAVDARYGLVGARGLDRGQTVCEVRNVIDWATEHVGRRSAQDT